MKILISLSIAILIFNFSFSQLPSGLIMRSDKHKLGNYGIGVDTVHYDFVNNYNVDFLITKDTIYIFDKDDFTIKLSSIGYLEDLNSTTENYTILFCKDKSIGEAGENCRFIFGTDNKIDRNFVIITNKDKVVYFNISKVFSTDDCAVKDFVSTLPKYKYEK